MQIGFHGHNNLDLAVANSLRAIELGAAIVDTSLQGFGRSAGNTPTEVFLGPQAIGPGYGDRPAYRHGHQREVHPSAGAAHGYDSIDVVTGLAGVSLELHGCDSRVLEQVPDRSSPADHVGLRAGPGQRAAGSRPAHGGGLARTAARSSPLASASTAITVRSSARQSVPRARARQGRPVRSGRARHRVFNVGKTIGDL